MRLRTVWRALGWISGICGQSVRHSAGAGVQVGCTLTLEQPQLIANKLARSRQRGILTLDHLDTSRNAISFLLLGHGAAGLSCCCDTCSFSSGDRAVRLDLQPAAALKPDTQAVARPTRYRCHHESGQNTACNG
ncbi:MAG TPA: hypothetical protein PLI17_10215 [Denitromonas sp.]|nr:hypothetical protein [Denitromonas sp.]